MTPREREEGLKVPYSRIYAQVDLDCITDNIRAVRRILPPETAVIGVVKADGYGHGGVPVARAIAPFVEAFAVATVDEGIQLKEHGIRQPVMILGETPDVRLADVIAWDLQPAVFSLKQAQKLAGLARERGTCACIQLALDTGMGRIGWQPDEAAAGEAAAIAAMDGVKIMGLFTHFARCDERDQTFTRLQLERYRHFAELLRERGVHIPMTHCANSAGITEEAGTAMDAVRAGIVIYGMYPSDQVSREKFPLKPAMEIKSFITFVKEVPEGTPISYGGTFVAPHPMRVATVSAGYGDGYPRNLSGRGAVLVRGKRAGILGRVCMDQFMIDVTDIPEAAEGDTVTLAGRDGEEFISLEEMAAACGGFHYEIPCVLGKRVPRVYVSGGRVIGTKDYFKDRYDDF